MKHATTFVRKHVCMAALSFALLPLAATAQTQVLSQTTDATTRSAASQPHSATSQPHSGQQSMGASTGASATGAATASGQAGTAKSTGAMKPVATFVLVPVASPLHAQWMKTGCWAKLHDKVGFAGDSLTLNGPLDMADMVGPFGINWKGKVSSIETGANTTLTVYDNVNFRDKVSTYKPGERVADISKRMGYFDDMRSVRITCTGAGAAATR